MDHVTKPHWAKGKFCVWVFMIAVNVSVATCQLPIFFILKNVYLSRVFNYILRRNPYAQQMGFFFKCLCSELNTRHLSYQSTVFHCTNFSCESEGLKVLVMWYQIFSQTTKVINILQRHIWYQIFLK